VTVTQTRFGEVDTAVLEELRESFDTHALLDAVTKIDQIRHCIDTVREELLRLHGQDRRGCGDNLGSRRRAVHDDAGLARRHRLHR
jgi:hypothetical protein